MDDDHEPANDDLLALFHFQPADGISTEEALGRIASESSVGTWTTLAQLPERILEMRGIAYAWDEAKGLAKVAYPRELWEPGNLPQVLSGVAGNIFGMKALDGLRLLDVSFPRELLDSFAGPHLGIPGLRDLLDVPERPLFATVPKPKLGWSAKEHAELGLEAWLGGLDLIKDDENLTDQAFNRFEERVDRLTKAREKAEAETGETKSALLNVTGETRTMLERLEYLADRGWEYAMIDVVTTGPAAVQTVRDAAGDHGMALHAHRAMHAMFTRPDTQGMAMPCLAKLMRIAGVDQIHTGTVVGKLVSPGHEVAMNISACRDTVTEEKEEQLAQDWGDMAPIFPVASGGLHPGLIPAILDVYGPDVVIQLGGGVHGHPDGTKAGAEALRAVTLGVMDGLTLEEVGEREPVVKVAMEKWGTEKPR